MIPAEENSSLFGILFNNNLIKKYNIKFDPYLRFDEDVLFNFYYDTLTKYEDSTNVYLQEYCYCHLIRENHTSLTGQKEKRLEHLMQFLISKTYALKLLLDLNDDNNFTTFIDLSFYIYCCFYPILENIIEEQNENIYIDINIFELFLQCCDYLNIIFTEFSNLFSPLYDKISVKELSAILSSLDIRTIGIEISDYSYYKEQLNNLRNKQMQIKINIIIPCYYPSSTIEPCLQSLADQTQKQHIQVILINDCSPHTDCEYNDIIQKYKSILNIKYLKTPQNSGPGFARQFGLDNIDNYAPYVMFIDDDDKLDNPYVIENYLKAISSYSSPFSQPAFIAGKRVSYMNNEIFECAKGNRLTGTLFYLPLIQLFNLNFQNSYYDEDSLFYIQYVTYIELFNYFYKQQYSLIELDNFIAYNYNINNPLSLTFQMNKEYTLKTKIMNILSINNSICKFYSQLNKIIIKQNFFKTNIYSVYGAFIYHIQLLINNNLELTLKEIKILQSYFNELQLLLSLIKYDINDHSVLLQIFEVNNQQYNEFLDIIKIPKIFTPQEFLLYFNSVIQGREHDDNKS